MADTQKRSNKALYLLLVLAATFIGLAIWNFVRVSQYSTQDNEFLSLSAQQAVLSQSIVRAADQAVAGKNDAFQTLLNHRIISRYYIRKLSSSNNLRIFKSSF